ncbi:hypothetical protein LIT38_17105 [Bacillus sp. CMF12]|uniref:hypothetical protein n=1 Tax=Bacillus sp. CMF12 TaxID=2884834 RepID=UPI0020798725|nr:hypothetical protein [Bacillus sp. CMF12]USK48268.1 hypothetical protein LIT38_17105 [Bacillus sp. CMF12]
MIVKYQTSARSYERKFKREMMKAGYYNTASGITNYIVQYGKNSITVKKQKGSSISITRGQLRRAISFTLFKRTIIRKDMEDFSSYSSALFGMINRIFHHIAWFLKLREGYRLSLKTLRFWASGLEREKNGLQLLKKIGGNFVLFNFFQILQSGPNCLKQLDRYNLYAYIDSGSFSLHNQKCKKGLQNLSLFDEQTEQDMILKGYADFINANKNNPRIIGFFPLDVIGDPEATKENYAKLKAMVPGANLIPVFQVSDSLKSLEMLVDEEHEVIALGGLIPLMKKGLNHCRATLDRIFNLYSNVNFHFLGGANELLLEYPFFSSDSTAYLNSRRNPSQ